MLLDFTYDMSDDWYRNEWMLMTQQSISEDWQKEIIDFLGDWFSDKSEFEIKTSGTTGPPKIESFPREAFISSARITINTFNLKKGDTLLMCLPMHFVAGKMMLIRAITGRMKILAIQPSANPVQGLQYPIEFAAFTPHQLQTILKINPNKIDLIEKAIIGGSLVNIELQDQLNDYKTQFYETFGMSETLTHVAIKVLNGGNISEHFKVLKGFKISVDENDRLIIEADHLKNSPLVTSDIVEFIDQNTFIWLGRSDDVINSGGVKLFPVAIENKLYDQIDREFVVGKRSNDILGEVVILFIEGEPFSKDRLAKLNSELTKLLTKFEIPKEILFINEFPRNKNGKVIRSEFG